MKTVSALEVRAHFGRIMDEAAAGERFVIERAGSPVAAIVPMSDLAIVDPERRRERERAALDELRRLAKRVSTMGVPISGTEAIRRDRDFGHRP
jgi:prevent-host-death family protein